MESIKLEVFHHFVKMNPSLLTPAYDLQKQLRRGIVNDEFWMIYSKKRVEVYGVRVLLHVDEILSTIPRRHIPPTPHQVKERNKQPSITVPEETVVPEKGSKEWKRRKMSKHNKEQQYVTVCPSCRTSHRNYDRTIPYRIISHLSDRDTYSLI